ncbi:MAG: acetyl-CoA decarbonylase/synthase complex subunit delta [Clostridiales Family XIII bacterium]|jgi:acetyl-CoA decarbonylase/synthase complex subunit delta|nr:acetyl-CoA decarbonylase/synthase complex subunit delta [Clostridiales Family XIII bacterium]
MAFKKDPQVFGAKITEVAFGADGASAVFGGGNTLPLYSFDAETRHRPLVGIEFSDKGPDRSLPGLAEFYEGADSLTDVAARACMAQGADFVSLVLESADPNGDDIPSEDAAALAKEAAKAAAGSGKPIVIQGTGNVDKDQELIPKIAEALQGMSALLLSAKEENYKGIAVAAVTAYGQKIGAESSVDINLAKQLNVLIAQMGIQPADYVMNLGTAAAGYGFEYIASTIERVKLAALSQNDDALQMPVITPVALDAWSVKEAVVSEEDFPEWGPREERGVQMEISTAAAALAAGSDAVILRHPASVKTVSELVTALV